MDLNKIIRRNSIMKINNLIIREGNNPKQCTKLFIREISEANMRDLMSRDKPHGVLYKMMRAKNGGLDQMRIPRDIDFRIFKNRDKKRGGFAMTGDYGREVYLDIDDDPMIENFTMGKLFRMVAEDEMIPTPENLFNY